MSVLSFTWNGQSSDDHGVCVKSLPFLYTPGERFESCVIPGRDGVLRIPDGGMEEIALLVDCYLPYEQGVTVSDMRTIREWLRGEGWFTQSDLPGRAFKAKITDAIAFQPWVDGFADRLFSITLYAEPYQYHYPEAEKIVLTAAGTVSNPGTAHSLPRIAITGSGDFTVSIGGTYMEFSGVSGGVIVDSERMDVLAQDGLTLANSCAAMAEFPKLQPGPNAVSWTGGVTKMEILPRWRDR